MTRLQVLQGKLNQGESLEVVEALTKALPLSGAESPKVALERAKQEAFAREQINSTQAELARVAEMKKKQQEELELAKSKIEELKNRKSSSSLQKQTSLQSMNEKMRLYSAQVRAQPTKLNVELKVEDEDEGDDGEYDYEYDPESASHLSSLHSNRKTAVKEAEQPEIDLRNHV